MIVELFPPKLLLILTEFSLLVIGYVSEKHYVSRMASFANAIALTIHVLSIEQVGVWLGLYVDVGIAIGIVGLLAYWSNTKLPSWYYDISYLLYSSLNVGLVIALSSTSFLIPLVVGAVLQVVIMMFSGDTQLIHSGQYSGAVKKFHQQKRRFGNQVIDLSGYFY